MSRRNLAWYVGSSSDELISHLKMRGWSLGEVGSSDGWKAYAQKEGLLFEGTARDQFNAWQDLLMKMMLAGRFSQN